MVLWEIALATAYFLGLKRTYRLGLKIQRKLISDKHPKLRQFVQSRTRNVFDVALTANYKIQEKGIVARWKLGKSHWIVQWVERMKSHAQINGTPSSCTNISTKSTRHSNNSSHHDTQGGFLKDKAKSTDKKSDRLRFTTAQKIWPESLPTIAMMMRPTSIAGHNILQRHYHSCGAELFTVNYGRSGFEEVTRNDIWQWLHH